MMRMILVDYARTRHAAKRVAQTAKNSLKNSPYR